MPAKDNAKSEVQTPQQQEIKVALDTSRLKNSYANVFETRFSDSEIFLSCGISHLEQQNGENVLAIQLENRIVMTPDSALRLNQALSQILAQWNSARGAQAE